MRKCKWCKQDFEPSRPDRVFCRKKCKDYYCRWKTGSGRNSQWRRKGIRIIVEDYNKLFDAQDGKCAICKRLATKFKRKLSVDHDHKTGKIRGLLCYQCNSGLGFFRDNADELQWAADYLKSKNTI